MTNLLSVEEVGKAVEEVRGTTVGYASADRRKAINDLLDLATAYLSAATELPEEMPVPVEPKPSGDISYAKGFNAALSQARLVVLKLKAEIEELKKEIKDGVDWQNRIIEVEEQNHHLQIRIAEKEEENRILKVDIETLEEQVSFLQQAQAKQIPSDKDLMDFIVDYGIAQDFDAEDAVNLLKGYHALLAGKKSAENNKQEHTKLGGI